MESGEDYLALGSALSRQRRLREAVSAYSEAIRLLPGDQRSFRAWAVQYLRILQPALARTDFLRCGELGGSLPDIWYHVGICDYLLGEHDLAVGRFQAALPLCGEEMRTPVIYWHTLSCCRSGRRLGLLGQYSGPAGRSTAYDQALQLFQGAWDDEALLAALGDERDDEAYVTALYGCCVYWQRHLRQKKVRLWMPRLLERDREWTAFPYLAAWNDCRESGQPWLSRIAKPV